MKVRSRFNRPYGTCHNRRITFPAINRWAILIASLRDGARYGPVPDSIGAGHFSLKRSAPFGSKPWQARIRRRRTRLGLQSPLRPRAKPPKAYGSMASKPRSGRRTVAQGGAQRNPGIQGEHPMASPQRGRLLGTPRPAGDRPQHGWAPRPGKPESTEGGPGSASNPHSGPKKDR